MGPGATTLPIRIYARRIGPWREVAAWLVSLHARTLEHFAMTGNRSRKA